MLGLKAPLYYKLQNLASPITKNAFGIFQFWHVRAKCYTKRSTQMKLSHYIISNGKSLLLHYYKLQELVKLEEKQFNSCYIRITNAFKQTLCIGNT